MLLKHQYGVDFPKKLLLNALAAEASKLTDKLCGSGCVAPTLTPPPESTSDPTLMKVRECLETLGYRDPLSSAPPAAVANYPVDIIEVASKRPAAIRGWDFLYSPLGIPHANANLYGYSLSAASEDLTLRPLTMSKLLMDNTIDPIETPSKAIQWVQSVICLRQVHGIVPSQYPTLLQAIEYSLGQSQMTRGYKGLLGHPAMLAVTADTKFCWALACFIDFFSSAHYTNSVMDHFRGLSLLSGLGNSLLLKVIEGQTSNSLLDLLNPSGATTSYLLSLTLLVHTTPVLSPAKLNGLETILEKACRL
jgi:hypothetical protein